MHASQETSWPLARAPPLPSRFFALSIALRPREAPATRDPETQIRCAYCTGSRKTLSVAGVMSSENRRNLQSATRRICFWGSRGARAPVCARAIDRTRKRDRGARGAPKEAPLHRDDRLLTPPSARRPIEIHELRPPLSRVPSNRNSPPTAGGGLQEMRAGVRQERSRHPSAAAGRRPANGSDVLEPAQARGSL